jgi:hypothetical protein
MNGAGSMYHVLRDEMGPTAPNKNQVSTFMRALTSVQINKTTKSMAGKKCDRPDVATAHCSLLMCSGHGVHPRLLQSDRQAHIQGDRGVHLWVNKIPLRASVLV